MSIYQCKRKQAQEGTYSPVSCISCFKNRQNKLLSGVWAVTLLFLMELVIKSDTRGFQQRRGETHKGLCP